MPPVKPKLRVDIDFAVGKRGTVQCTNTVKDQNTVIELLFQIPVSDGGLQGIPFRPPVVRGKCDATLAAAILTFQSHWVMRGKLGEKGADGAVDKGGATIRLLNELTGEKPDHEGPHFVFDLKVLRVQQTLPGGILHGRKTCVTPSSIRPFLTRPPSPPVAALELAPIECDQYNFLFKIEKAGALFWVGAFATTATADFSRAHIFFHPDTIGATDDAHYPTFSGRWPSVYRYVYILGTQMIGKNIPFFVPFMTNRSRNFDATNNLFAARGEETIQDLVHALQISMAKPASGSVSRVGLSSFSSGVNHMSRVASRLGSNMIKEQIDFDSGFIVNRVEKMPNIGGMNWMVAQVAPKKGFIGNWIELNAHAWRRTGPGDLHNKIGNDTFQAMMGLSIV